MPRKARTGPNVKRCKANADVPQLVDETKIEEDVQMSENKKNASLINSVEEILSTACWCNTKLEDFESMSSIYSSEVLQFLDEFLNVVNIIDEDSGDIKSDMKEMFSSLISLMGHLVAQITGSYTRPGSARSTRGVIKSDLRIIDPSLIRVLLQSSIVGSCLSNPSFINSLNKTCLEPLVGLRSVFSNVDELFGVFILHLARTVLTHPVRKTGVSKLWSFKDCFVALNYASEDSSCEDLVDMILGGLWSHEFLLSPDGHKLMTFFLSSLHPSVTLKGVTNIDELTLLQPNTAKAQLALDALGRVAFNAWKNASDSAIKDVWEAAYADWSQKCILAPVDKTAKYMRLLSPLLDNREHTVTQLIHKLFHSIVFINLPVANWEVRLNAAVALFRCFPLCDPSLPSREYDIEMDKQFEVFVSLLADPHPSVRCSVVQGLFRLFKTSWQLFPVDVSSRILHFLIHQSSRDSNSPEVRRSVVLGFNLMFTNPLTHDSTAFLIKDLSHLICDPCPGVRLEFSRLLESCLHLGTDGDVSQLLPLDLVFSRLCSDHIRNSVDQESHDTSRASQKRRESFRLMAGLIAKAFQSTDVGEMADRVLGFVDQAPFTLLTISPFLLAGSSLLDRLRLVGALIRVTLASQKENGLALLSDTSTAECRLYLIQCGIVMAVCEKLLRVPESAVEPLSTEAISFVKSAILNSDIYDPWATEPLRKLFPKHNTVSDGLIFLRSTIYSFISSNGLVAMTGDSHEKLRNCVLHDYVHLLGQTLDEPHSRCLLMLKGPLTRAAECFEVHGEVLEMLLNQFNNIFASEVQLTSRTSSRKRTSSGTFAVHEIEKVVRSMSLTQLCRSLYGLVESDEGRKCVIHHDRLIAMISEFLDGSRTLNQLQMTNLEIRDASVILDIFSRMALHVAVETNALDVRYMLCSQMINYVEFPEDETQFVKKWIRVFSIIPTDVVPPDFESTFLRVLSVIKIIESLLCNIKMTLILRLGHSDPSDTVYYLIRRWIYLVACLGGACPLNTEEHTTVVLPQSIIDKYFSNIRRNIGQLICELAKTTIVSRVIELLDLLMNCYFVVEDSSLIDKSDESIAVRVISTPPIHQVTKKKRKWKTTKKSTERQTKSTDNQLTESVLYDEQPPKMYSMSPEEELANLIVNVASIMGLSTMELFNCFFEMHTEEKTTRGEDDQPLYVPKSQFLAQAPIKRVTQTVLVFGLIQRDSSTNDKQNSECAVTADSISEAIESLRDDPLSCIRR